jgi:3-isopropylmalate/(R)-2-methylmalate dehydratase large subunit
MTVCNLSIELGAKIGMVAPDQTTYDYLKGRRHAPKGASWDQALAHWKMLASDPGAKFDVEHAVDCATLAPQITWGTSPEDVIGVDAKIPDNKPEALTYMGLTAGKPIAGTRVDRVFIGSCTNSRRRTCAAAAEWRAARRPKRVQAWVVPGSWRIKQDAEAEGCTEVFKEAGFEWREAGCSMCVAANGDYGGASAAFHLQPQFRGPPGRTARVRISPAPPWPPPQRSPGRNCGY